MIDDFNKLNLSIKWILASLAIIMPFWYLIIFLLNPHFVSYNAVHIPIVLSFCLSLVMEVSFSFVAYRWVNLTGTDDDGDTNVNFALSTGITVVWATIVAYICYCASLSLVVCINISCWVAVALGSIAFVKDLVELRKEK
jgi:hypothetical protein